MRHQRYRGVFPAGLSSFIGAVLTASALLVSQAAAQSDNFNGSVDPNWTHYAPLDAYGTTTTFTDLFNAYKITTSGSPDVGNLGPARAGSLRPDKTYSDFAVAVDLVGWDISHSQPLGLLTRITSPGLGTTNGYALTYDTTGHTLDLTRITGEQTTGIGSAPVTTNAGVLHLLFTGIGSTLTGQIFDGSNLATPLATVSTVDGTYGSGINGLVIYDNSDGTHGATGTFDNYAAATSLAQLIPEPASLTLLCCGVLAMLRRPDVARK